MLKRRIAFFVLATIVVWSSRVSASTSGTWRLDEGRQWEAVSAESKDKFLLAATEIKKLVDTGKAKAARKAFDALKKDFPEIAGPDLNLFIKAEMFYCKGKLYKTIKTHDKLLNEYPNSKFREAALDRQFSIASAFLGGQTKKLLGLFTMKRYAEGVKIMEKITERTGIDSPMGADAAVAVARNYQKRKKYNDAYLKWWEISLQYAAGPIGKEALISMANCERAFYNEYPEKERPLFDASGLSTAKSCYEKFRLLYPKDAEEMGIDKILKEINEQLARKQYTIGRYYQRMGNKQAANLYYDMVVSDWPDSKAAEMAKQTLAHNQISINSGLAPSEQ